MKFSIWLFAWAAVSTATLANARQTMTAKEEARALVGVEYVVPMPGEKIAPRLSCINEGGGRIFIDGAYQDEYYGMRLCRGRTVVTLERVVSNVNDRITRRVVDTLLLPPIRPDWDARKPNALTFVNASNCELKGQPNNDFVAVVSWGNRERLDSRHGVKQVWIFDIEQGRIVPLDSKDIVCEWPKP